MQATLNLDGGRSRGRPRSRRCQDGCGAEKDGKGRSRSVHDQHVGKNDKKYWQIANVPNKKGTNTYCGGLGTRIAKTEKNG